MDDPSPPVTAVPASRQRRGEKQTAARARREKKTAVGRDAAGRFVAGFSGNPNGSKIVVPDEVRTAALTLSVEAIERLAYWMRSGDSQASIMSAKIILDRGLGKAIQPLIGSGGSLVNITLGAATVTAEDAARVYAELCGDPSLDVSRLALAAPMPAHAVERQSLPIESDVFAASIDAGRTAKLLAKCAQ